MRHVAWSALALLVVAGCSRRHDWDYGDEYEQEPVGSYDPTLMVDPTVYEIPKTSELGTEAVRGVAKTVDWPNVSTIEGTKYCGGTVVVDAVRRQDAMNFYGVRVRLKNRDTNPTRVEWKIAFYTSDGARLFGVADQTGEDGNVYRPVAIDGLGLATVSNACRVKGAVSFRLFVRKAGANDEGQPDAGQTGADDSLERLKRLEGLK